MNKVTSLALTALLLAPLAVVGEPQCMEDVARIPAGQFLRLQRDAGTAPNRSLTASRCPSNSRTISTTAAAMLHSGEK